MSGSPNAIAHVESLLETYHAGALPPEDAARVERHLRVCAACRERSDAIAVYQIIRSAPAPTVGPELRQRLYARIAEAVAADHQSHGPRRAALAARHASGADESGHLHAVTRGGWLSGVAAALLVALLVGVFWALPHIRQQNHASKKVVTKPTTACPASKTTADLPANLTLNDLAMTSATDGWAVGAIDDSSGQPTQGVILRYSDCHWSQIALDLKEANLTHISMDSPTDGWATGEWTENSANFSDGFLLMRYTGGAWSVVPAAQRPTNRGSVLALSMRAPNDGWLLTNGPDTFQHGAGDITVGVSRLWHYQQGAWTLVAPAPIQMLEVIAPAGPDDLWAAGSTFTDPYKDQAQYLAHYHNGAWTQVASPGGLQVWSMRAVSPTDVWVSGELNNGNGYNAVAHYDGVAWRMAPDAVPALPTPALTPGATVSPTTRTMPTPQPGQFNGLLTITSDGAGWAYNWKPILNPVPESPAVIGNVYREDGGVWQSLNWPYADVGAITSWAALPDGEVWATGTLHTVGNEITPLPGGGGTMSATFHAYLLHYANGEWTRYPTISMTT